MVYVGLPQESEDRLAGELQQRDVLVYKGNPLRLVTHLDVSTEDIDRALEAFREVLG